MTVEQLRQLYYAEPFSPFVFVLAEGEEVLVPHREWFSFSPTGNRIVVTDPKRLFRFIDPQAVVKARNASAAETAAADSTK